MKKCSNCGAETCEQRLQDNGGHCFNCSQPFKEAKADKPKAEKPKEEKP